MYTFKCIVHVGQVRKIEPQLLSKTKTRCYAGTPGLELLAIRVWPYDFAYLELGHDPDLQNNDLDQIDPNIT